MVNKELKEMDLTNYHLVLLPGFIQWDSTELELKYKIPIRKGTEFASELPELLKQIKSIELSNKVSATQLIKSSGDLEYKKVLKKRIHYAKNHLNSSTFFINELRSDLIVGKNLPPPIIAEIVNCTQKSDENIIKKVKHYVNSGADIIDIGCVSNKPNPNRVTEIIDLIREKFNILLSIDSMNKNEILSAVEADIDMILSFDIGNYKEFTHIPKDIPIVILPTNIKKGYFPKDAHQRIKNLHILTEKLQIEGFEKLIADPLLETPISPGINNSLYTYMLYQKISKKKSKKPLELPMFFGISNVVELMDIDSIGINGLLASIAIELDMGILFTVEHSTKMMGGVYELNQAIKLNYISKFRKTPPINQGIEIFKAKGKISQSNPSIQKKKAIYVNTHNNDYIRDKKGYFKIYTDHYEKKIYVLHYSNENILKQTLIGSNAESLNKKILGLNLTNDLYHINYIGRELKKAEICLELGKPYIQDQEFFCSF